jgi:hypothetical protein
LRVGHKFLKNPEKLKRKEKENAAYDCTAGEEEGLQGSDKKIAEGTM